ncbi:VOC family protein [Tenacibaculum amylolyticum]|uniref:VOC family protein n=1 Tax=Tenacibaculum amylolyticum TaxID=104269 RepID=UPI003896003A
MKTKVLTGILVVFIHIGFTQNISKSEKNTIMEESKFLGLRTTIYKVGNITEAKEWYAKAFETKPYFDESFYVGFNIGGYELGLQPEKESVTNKSESVVTYWEVTDIQEMYARLLKLGATEHEKPYNVGGAIMTATVKDPYGNIIGLIYNPDFKITKE